MNWFRDLFARRPVPLTSEQATALEVWRALPETDRHAALDRTRWVVVDVESSGLDAHRDRLISIGAVAVCGAALNVADSFEVVLRQTEVSRTENILVHGIGGTVQREGVAPAEALLQFLAYAQKSPIVAFHAAFDTLMIGRALRTHLGVNWAPKVIDLADVMPACFPAVQRCRNLDDWISHFGITHFARHQAVSDAYSTAQLLQVALAITPDASFSVLDAMQREQRALSRLGAVR